MDYSLDVSEALDCIREEVERAHRMHGDMSLLNPDLDVGLKLAALMEEVGEVAHECTYDSCGHTEALIFELVQVACVAASWAQSLLSQQEAKIR